MTVQSRGPRKIPVLVELPQGMADPLVPLAQQEGALPLEAVFARRAPVEVEVGTGKGHTLATLAQRDADVDFLGIEVGSRWVRLARVRLIRAALPNARLIHGEAEWILDRYLAPGSVRRFHVYFPDPWPKKRHVKRRLFRPGFAALMARCLETGGEVRIATDHAAYFEQIRDVMDAAGFRHRPDAAWPENPVSSFEAKYRHQGRTIQRAVYSPPAG
jgi:tRNA (guanine-N7-)-methyltransferase